MSKYICTECNCGFVEPKVVSIDEFYGITREFDYPSDGFVDLCPYCESNDIEEQIQYYYEIEDKEIEEVMKYKINRQLERIEKEGE